ncbi:helix-turn-helix transcriptional regulator [Pediococcus inopinatus]|uniref:helix-turn-helix transcriptional regulator n=1 Tax=Pediococcus inopinatus TaxID=114090 RepID=UPI0007C4BFF2|nr:helix-turn-helix transcriptional regulator [Pediococcus inopinatus]
MIDNFLKKYNLTRYQVAKISGVPESTLVSANDSRINSLSVRVLQALAMATGKTPGAVLDELIKQQGNPIIVFIQSHPGLNKKLVSDIENLMIDLHNQEANVKNVTFNRYYDEGDDTNERATIAMQNLKTQLIEFKHNLK